MIETIKFPGVGLCMSAEECMQHIKNLPKINAVVVDEEVREKLFDAPPDGTLKQLSEQIKNLKDDLAVVKHKGAKELIATELKRVKNEHYKLSQLLQGLNLSKLYGKKKVEVVDLNITREMWKAGFSINVRATALVNGIRVEVNHDFPANMVDTVGKARQAVIDCLS